MNTLIKKIVKAILTPQQIIQVKKLKQLLQVKYLAYVDWIATEYYNFYFKHFYKKTNNKVRIILVECGDYGLYRKKEIGNIIIECGIGNLFENMGKYNAGMEFEIILIINGVNEEQGRHFKELRNKHRFIGEILFRDNAGLDFGGYDFGYQYLKSIDYKEDVLFMNSSVRGPCNDYWLVRYSHLFHKRKDIGLCGISMNSHTTHLRREEFKPHVQSFFLYTSMSVLNASFGDYTPGAFVNADDKQESITEGEIGFSQKVLDKKYGICSRLFDNFVYYKGDAWRIPTGDLRYNPVYSQFANKI